MIKREVDCLNKLYMTNEDMSHNYLEKLNLVEKDGKYFLEISILTESKFGTKRCNVIAKLPIVPSMFSVRRDLLDEKEIDLGFGYLPVINLDTEDLTSTETEHSMTLSEIEKILGYKIKLVDERNDINDDY